MRKYLLLSSLLPAALLAACTGKEPVADVEAQAFAELHAELKIVIEDPQREAQVAEVVDTLIEDLENMRAAVTARKHRARELNASYDTTREEFIEFVEDIDEEIRRSQRKVTETRRALLEVTTAEEREALNEVRSGAMKAAIKSIQAI